MLHSLDGGRDPNYAGGSYHGMRMNPGSYQAAYGRYRLNHQVALGGHGGFDGIYDEGQGTYNRDGQFDVIVFRRFSKVRLLRHLASIAFGRRRVDPELELHRSRTVRITFTAFP